MLGFIPEAAPLLAAVISVTIFYPLPINCDLSRQVLFSEPPPFLLSGVVALPLQLEEAEEQSLAPRPG